VEWDFELNIAFFIGEDDHTRFSKSGLISESGFERSSSNRSYVVEGLYRTRAKVSGGWGTYGVSNLHGRRPCFESGVNNVVNVNVNRQRRIIVGSRDSNCNLKTHGASKHSITTIELRINVGVLIKVLNIGTTRSGVLILVIKDRGLKTSSSDSNGTSGRDHRSPGEDDKSVTGRAKTSTGRCDGKWVKTNTANVRKALDHLSE
jgi:hypothetical protein